MACFSRAIEDAEASSTSVLRKAEFWRAHAKVAMSERQRAVLDRYLDGPAISGRVLTPSGQPVLARISVDEVKTHEQEQWTTRCRDGRFARARARTMRPAPPFSGAGLRAGRSRSGNGIRDHAMPAAGKAIVDPCGPGARRRFVCRSCFPIPWRSGRVADNA